MWMPVCGPLPELRFALPAQMVYLFLQSIIPTVPAGWLTFAEGVVYQSYDVLPRVWGISVTDDQQMAGLIMKVGGGAVPLDGDRRAVLPVRCTRRSEDDTQLRPVATGIPAAEITGHDDVPLDLARTSARAGRHRRRPEPEPPRHRPRPPDARGRPARGPPSPTTSNRATPSGTARAASTGAATAQASSTSQPGRADRRRSGRAAAPRPGPRSAAAGPPRAGRRQPVERDHHAAEQQQHQVEPVGGGQVSPRPGACRP